MKARENHHRPDGVDERAIQVYRAVPDGNDRPVEWLLNLMRGIGWKPTALGAKVTGDQVSIWAVPPSKQVT